MISHLCPCFGYFPLTIFSLLFMFRRPGWRAARAWAAWAAWATTSWCPRRRSTCSRARRPWRRAASGGATWWAATTRPTRRCRRQPTRSGGPHRLRRQVRASGIDDRDDSGVAAKHRMLCRPLLIFLFFINADEGEQSAMDTTTEDDSLPRVSWDEPAPPAERRVTTSLVQDVAQITSMLPHISLPRAQQVRLVGPLNNKERMKERRKRKKKEKRKKEKVFFFRGGGLFRLAQKRMLTPLPPSSA